MRIMRRCQTGRDPPSPRCHINSGYMRRWIDKPSSTQPKEQEAPCQVWHINTGAYVRIPQSNYLLVSPQPGNVNQHFLLVELLWTTGTLRRHPIPFEFICLFNKISQITDLKTIKTLVRQYHIYTFMSDHKGGGVSVGWGHSSQHETKQIQRHFCALTDFQPLKATQQHAGTCLCCKIYN